MARFQLVSEFQPTGDQPEAIAALVEGLRRGYQHQTLLGATGTGKSLDGDEPILVWQKEGGGWIPQLLPIGKLVDEWMESHPASVRIGDTWIVSFSPEDSPYQVLSLNPSTGQTERKPVTSLIRHRAPNVMYRVRTACGREALVTGDHNFWILRDGQMLLLPTAEIREGDWIPLPPRLPAPSTEITSLNLLSVLAEENLYVAAQDQVREMVAAGGYRELVALLRPYYEAPWDKLYAVLHNQRGSRIPVGVFKELLERSPRLRLYWRPEEARIVGKLDRCSLPTTIPISGDLLRLIGYYLAEGNSQSQSGYFVWSNLSPEIQQGFENALTSLGIPFTRRNAKDYQVSSAPLALLLRHLAGSRASDKHLPPFWPQLSDAQLGLLLRAYFDGDGYVERSSAICCTTASQHLAYDVAWALLRFGIWARIRRVWKRATNSSHSGAWYWQITISGQENLQKFRQFIGFGVKAKSLALEQQLSKGRHSNVDVVPGCADRLRYLREELGLSKKQMARLVGISRSAIYLFETGRRNPLRPTLERILNALREVARSHNSPNLWWEEWAFLERLGALRWTVVESVEPLPYDKPFVYDVSVVDNETFLAGQGGMFLHNTYVMAKVIEAVQRPTLVISHNKTLAAQLYAEFRQFFPHNAVEYFVSYYDYYQPEAYLPQYDLYIEKDADINEEIDRLRLAAMSAVFSRRDVIIVASVSCIYAIGDPQEWGRVTLRLARGERHRRETVLRHLVSIYYERNDMELARGRFRVRGDTLEVMPAHSETAYRIGFWGDEIERIAEIHPLTGEVLKDLDEVHIFPAKVFITPDEKREKALADIEAELEERLKELRAQGKLLEAQRLEQRTRYDIEMIREVGYCAGIENYSRHLQQRPPGSPPWTLMDYFPADYLLIVDESHMTIPQIRGMYNGDRSRKETLVEYGFRLPSALDNRPLTFEEFEARVNQVIYTSATPGPYELQKSQQVVQQIIRPTGIVDPEIIVRPAKGQVDDLIGRIRERVERGERVLVTTLTKRMAEDLSDYLRELGIKVHYLHSEVQTIERVEILRDLRMGVYDVVVGINLLREGLDLPEVSLVAILDADKEGFLRSETALIQTIGRAARHVHGTAVLYADRITDSMKRAIEETERRRAIQMKYNQEHGITPATIVKEIRDLTDRVRSQTARQPDLPVTMMPRDDLARMIRELEKQMKKAAEDLEFEKAAMLRDRIFELRAMLAEKEERLPPWERDRRLAAGEPL
jgi:excinuclease ABC B subunit